MDQSLVTVMKSIGEAIKLDGMNKHQDAYIKYVECILSVVSNLLHNVKTGGGHVVITKEIVRHVQLGQQCFDRVASLVDTITVQTTFEDQTRDESADHNTPLERRFSDPVPPLQEEKPPHAFVRKKENRLSPMEIAYKQNQQLMAAYKARMARMNKGDCIATSLSLTIQRKMAENLAIGKAQEEALAKKMKERQLRLDEHAARRFTAPVGMSKEEQEQRQIFKKILEYEQDTKWLSKWREKLEANPQDSIVINQLIQEILRCSDHPLTQLLKTYQFKIYEKLYPLVSKKMALLKDIAVPLPVSLYPKEIQEELKSTDTKKDTVSDKTSPLACKSEVAENSEELSVVNSGDISSRENDNENQRIADEFEHSEMAEDKVDGIPVGDSSTNEVVASKHKSDKSPQNIAFELENKEKCKEDNKSDAVPEPVEGSTSNSKIDLEEDKVSCEHDVEGSASLDTEDICQKSREDLDIAAQKGEKLQRQLTLENEKARAFVMRISEEYEQYNQDNMDDLFDDLFDNEDDSGMLSSTEFSSLSINSLEKDMKSLDTSSMSSTHCESSLTNTNNNEMSKMSEEAYKRHLKAISQDVHTYMEKLLVMFTIAYEHLDSPTGRDQCYALLEEPFFKSVWKYLLVLFRMTNKAKEIALAYKMTVNENDGPWQFGVIDKLCLSSCDGDYPYQSAVEELARVKDHYTMLSKLECVVRVCRLACSCVEQYYAKDSMGHKKCPNVGADDLVPILSYIVVKSRLPQLVSECSAMEEFIHEGYIMGEEGYCLTSLQTAISYVSSLSESQL